jgi:DNA-binding response OmpR family regulator
MNLRRKLEDDPTCPRYLVSVRGLGYRFENPDDQQTGA